MPFLKHLIRHTICLNLNFHGPGLTPEISEILEKVSVSTTFAQSRPVSVSTPFKFHGLKESRSRQLSKYPVSKSLGLDNFCSVLAGLGLDTIQISWSRRVLVLTTPKISSLKKSQSRHLLFFESRRFTVNKLY